ncbi:transglycosylase domain-containing protein [Patescibacteria group bacterium]
MARIRTGKNLLNKQYLPHSFFGWVLFILENIGRLTYKIFFLILTIPLKACFYALYTLSFIFKNIIYLIYKVLSLIVNKLICLIKLIAHFKLPKVSLPKPKPIKVPLPKAKIPSFPKAKFPSIKFPSFRIPFFGFFRKAPILSFLILFTTIISLYFYINILKDLPGPDKLQTRDQIVSTKIYDRHENLLFTVYNGDQNRSLIKLEEIPEQVKLATIAIEDKDFYKHPGFSIRGITRAIWKNFFNPGLEGGSTITQQLIKNALLTPEKTWQRKLKELILSIQTELIFSKDEILQMYFNEVPYGGTAYGVEEAALTYLGKSIKDVNLAEAALLAGLPAAPTKYSPFGANPKLAVERQHQVLNDMVKENYISKEQEKEAKNQKIILAPQKTNIKAPHFVMYVKDLLVEKYGTKVIEQGGLKVITSLDLNIQEMTQQKVTEEINKLANMNISNGAALVTNPKTGEVLAMVGSRDYFNKDLDGNVNVTIMPRQPGSSIKVVTYAVALENGFTPATIIPDTPITYKVPGAEPYSPVNYDSRFHGNVSLRTALASSYNVPAVKTLAVFGVNKMIDKGEAMGITTWQNRDRFGLAITLGAGEVKMTDLAEVYGSIANLGQKVSLHPILEVTDYKGRVLADFNHAKPERVLDANVAYLLTDILKDNNARMPAFGPTSYLVIPNHEVAVKTGTTNDKRDNWTIGYTQDYLVSVWVGNNDNSPMSAVASGITGASPIWNYIMLDLLANKPSQQFNRPESLIKLSVCTLNGLLSCEGCPSKEEYFLPGTEPKYHCNSEEIKKLIEEKEKQKDDNILEGISIERL